MFTIFTDHSIETRLRSLNRAYESIKPPTISQVNTIYFDNFIDFTLVAESELPATEVPDLGVFQLLPGDAMSKFR